MRLTDLEPKWVGLHNWASPSPFYVGVRFNCPHCLVQKLAVLFDPPIDPERVAATFGTPLNLREFAKSNNTLCWTRVSGDTFVDLTLAPSINAQQFANHWHGCITNGEVSAV